MTPSLRHRRLEDYYAYVDDVKQHPWYTHIMIIILIALVVFSVGFGFYYQVIVSRKPITFRSVTKCTTDEVMNEDDSEMEMGIPRNPRQPASSWKNPPSGPHEDYVNFPDEGRGVVA